MTTATLTRTDREIQADVLAELHCDRSIPGTEIGVAVKDGVVTLTGTVDTFWKKWKAEEDAHKVNGVIAVADDITARVIRESTDTGIAAAAVHAAKWNTSVPAEKIQVKVEDDSVTLAGEVVWQYQRQEVERAVRRLWASELERGSELDEQIFRLQCLVSHLLEKNEELRQRLARQASGKEGQRFTGQRSGVH